MKMLLIAGTSLIALTTGSMAADMPASGMEPSVAVASAWDAFVAAGAGYTWFDSDDIGGGELDDLAAEIRASAAYQFSNGFAIQSDVVFNHQGLGDDVIFDGANVASVDVAGHAFYRNESFLLGVFGQYGMTSPDIGFPIDIDRFYAGGEAQGYFGNFTLYAQGGWQGQDLAPIDEEPDGFFVNAEARYFAGDNLKLAINGGYATLGSDDEFDANTIQVGGSIEYRLDDNPLSVFGNVNYSETEIENTDIEFSDVRVMAGLKLNLGTQTLLERDRGGATLDPVKAPGLTTIFVGP
jgi:hypothetical protein